MAVETALLEFFLLIIAGLLTAIGWVARKYLRQIIGRIDTALQRLDVQEDRVEETREDVREIKSSLTGDDNTPWDGFIGETKKNARNIHENRRIIQANREAIKENTPTVEFNDIESQETYHDDWTR